MSLDIESAAKKICAKLLTTNTAMALPEGVAEALVILAFTYGAAWAINSGDMLALADAHIEALRSTHQ